MSEVYNVIVLGLGAMGSAAAYHLAAQGSRVLGIDRFHPPHTFGSSHGRTRIIREAYFEHPSYVPLVQRAYVLWDALEKTSGTQLRLQTGGLMIGRSDSTLVTGALRSANEHQLSHQLLSTAELRKRFPVFNPGEGIIAVWEPRAGILFPELIIQTHLKLAEKKGATLRFNECVLNWEREGNGVRVITSSGTHRAARLLLAAGAWLNSLFNPKSNPIDSPPQSTLPLSIERQVLFWFEPVSQHAQFQPQHCPIYIWEYEPGRFFYGFPDLGGGIKVAFHHQGEISHPDQLRRETDPTEVEAMRSLLQRLMPSAAGPLRSEAVCMYTNTPDEHFIFDWHPKHKQVLIASPCSGHGFKFSSVIGELAARLLTGRSVPFNTERFQSSRLQHDF
jgi:sarcosine oxidase